MYRWAHTASVFTYGIKYSMIVQSIHNTWDMVYNSYRNTVYKTLEDPKTHKKVVEVVQYLYDSKASIPPVNVKGQNLDVQA